MLVGLLIDDEPENSEYYYARCNIEMSEGQTSLALMDIEKAIELAPENTTYLVTAAQLMLAEGKRQQARALLDKAIGLGHDRNEISDIYRRCTAK